MFERLFSVPTQYFAIFFIQEKKMITGWRELDQVTLPSATFSVNIHLQTQPLLSIICLSKLTWKSAMCLGLLYSMQCLPLWCLWHHFLLLVFSVLRISETLDVELVQFSDYPQLKYQLLCLFRSRICKISQLVMLWLVIAYIQYSNFSYVPCFLSRTAIIRYIVIFVIGYYCWS